MLEAYFKSVHMFALSCAANSSAFLSAMTSTFCAEVSAGSGAASITSVDVLSRPAVKGVSEDSF